MAFAREALFGPLHHLPGWYPHEFLGSPFFANLQSFPWIPTRLILLLLDPVIAFAWGIGLAAGLSAVFAYLYCSRLGLSPVGSAVAGWTFACAGFFTSRVEAGQLGFLEAYPSLPLLLWLADRAIDEDRRKHRVRDFVLLAIASASFALAGHPQLPAYSIGAVLLYLLVRSRGRLRIQAIFSVLFGLGTTLFAWWPMLLLVRRSSRVLHLAASGNDIAMPYARLLALIAPGVDGWPDAVDASEQNPFNSYPNYAYFWDTASYVGLLPLIAALALLVWAVKTKRLPRGRWAFVTAMGVGALFLALPCGAALMRLLPGTLLRSPSRWLYISTFSVAAGLGFGVDAFLGSGFPTLRARRVIVVCALALHVFDVGAFANHFIETMPRLSGMPAFEEFLAREVKDARIGSEGAASVYGNRYDDAGIFDSILLAGPYRVILGLLETPDANEERLDASEFNIPALQACGVKFVITSEERGDLKLIKQTGEENLYEVPNPMPRAAFAGASCVGSDLKYTRPSGDEIVLHVNAACSGSVQVLEAFDPGWSAEVDGRGTHVAQANGYSMSVPVNAGHHEVRLQYHTPGLATGTLLALLSACLLIVVIWTTRYN